MSDEATKPKEQEVFVCQTCKSLRVACQMWADANTNDVLEDTERYRWCHACEEDGAAGEQKCLDTVPISQTREARRLVELELEPEPLPNARQEIRELKALLATIATYGRSHWDEAPEWPVEGWMHEAGEDDTRQGYADWVRSRIEEALFESGVQE